MDPNNICQSHLELLELRLSPVGEGECGGEGSGQLGAVADHQGGQEGGGKGEEGGGKVALGEEEPETGGEQAGSRGGEDEEESLRQHQGSANAHLHPLGPGYELLKGEILQTKLIFSHQNTLFLPLYILHSLP